MSLTYLLRGKTIVKTYTTMAREPSIYYGFQELLNRCTEYVLFLLALILLATAAGCCNARPLTLHDDYGRSWSCSEEEEGSILLCKLNSCEPNWTWAEILFFFLGVCLLILLFLMYLVTMGFKFRGIIRQVIFTFEMFVALDLPFYNRFFIKTVT